MKGDVIAFRFRKKKSIDPIGSGQTKRIDFSFFHPKEKKRKKKMLGARSNGSSHGESSSSSRGPVAAFFKKPVAQSEASRKVSRPAPLLTTRLPAAAVEREVDEVTPPLHGAKTQRSPSTAKTPIGNKKKTCLFPPQIPEDSSLDATAKPSLLDEYKARKSKAASQKDSSQSSKLAEASVRLHQSKSKEHLHPSTSKERLKASVDDCVVRGVQSLKIKCDAGQKVVESGPPPVDQTEKQKDSAYFNIVGHSLVNTQEVEDQNAPADAIVTWKDPDLWERYLAIEDRKRGIFNLF